MNLFLVRHGEIASNIKRVYAGKSPEPLTERGRRQAHEAGEKLKSISVEFLYASPIRRAVETAEIIGGVIGKNYTIMDEFREMEMGPWEGLSEEEVARLYPQEWSVWLNTPAELHLPGRETLGELLNRVLKGLKRIFSLCSEKKVAIVTHVAIIRVLILWHDKKDLNLYKSINIPNAQVYRLEISGTGL